MKYAFIANNDVLYCVESNVPPINGDWRLVVDNPPYYNNNQELIQTGWTLTDTTASPNYIVQSKPYINNANIENVPITPVIVPQVPQTITLWSFRAMLTVLGLVNAAESLMNSLPEPEKTVANIQWNYGNFIDRDHPLINTLGTQLGLTTEQIDNIFIEAAKLT